MLLEEVARKMASMGLASAVFAVACSIAGATGLTGGAIVVTALAMLGPGGMVGGLILLGGSMFVGDAVGKYGLERVLVAYFQERIRRGTAFDQAEKELRSLWISEDLKLAIHHQL